MHELAIAQGILDITLERAEECQAEKVLGIYLEIGQMAGIEPEALTFCFECLADGTKAQGAELKIESVPLTACCNTCKRTFPIERYRFLCPHCQSGNLTVLTGRELKVQHLEVE